MPSRTPPSIADLIRDNILEYLNDRGASNVPNLYETTIKAVEYPLIDAVLEFCDHNQSQAARILGISRTTLAKKINEYGLIDPFLLED